MIPLIPRKPMMNRYTSGGASSNNHPSLSSPTPSDESIDSAPMAMMNRYSSSNRHPSLSSPTPSADEASPSIDPAIRDLVGKKDSTNVSNNRWRRYGIERRNHLIEQDLAEGGSCFSINYTIAIGGYFQLVDKIITKFDESFNNGDDLEATYVMGNRLVHFLTEALPRHPSYMKRDPVVSRLREKSFQSLVRIKKQIDATALRIDEEELNKFILHDFDPFADDSEDDGDDESSAGSSDADPSCSSIDGGGGRRKEMIQWETFDGWSFDLPDKMVSQSTEFVQDISLLSCKDLDESGDTTDTFSSSEISFQESDGSSDQEPIYSSRGLDFLKQISSEAVRYETDSEADDSWAQESEEELEVESAPAGDMSFDPAKIALKELIINKRLLAKCDRMRLQNKSTAQYFDDQSDDYKENQSLDFDLSPDNTFDTEEEDIWIAFDPTARLPEAQTESLDRVSL